MRAKKVVSCARILENNALPVLAHARKLQRLEHVVRRLLPDELAPHCQVMNLKNETLLLGATSSAWATRLRFAVPRLIQKLNRQCALKLQTAQVRVQSKTPEFQSIKHHQLKLSLASGTLLAQTAQSLDHPGLQEALYRLAAKARDI